MPQSPLGSLNTPKAPGQIAYETYGDYQNWMTDEGLPMDLWADVSPETRTAWAAVELACSQLILEGLNGYVDRRWQQAHQTKVMTP